ncbi:mechanosensitive ion channel, partial [Desulfosarcina sp. OttesenSCG-928-G17]|nr:mechanosensitive ion channel [Desulfosarcina sp. OttesenSCG-928-G17]
MAIHAQLRRFAVILVLLVWVILFCLPVSSARCDDTAALAGDTAPAPSPPTLSRVVYRAGTLSQELVSLTDSLANMNNFKAMGKTLVDMEARVQEFETDMDTISAADLRGYQQLARLKRRLRSLSETVSMDTATLEQSLHGIETARQTWIDEKKQWDQWYALLTDDLSVTEVADAFSRAEADIAAAGTLLSEKLGPLLEIHRKTGNIQARIDALQARINTLMSQKRDGSLRSDTPPLFSSAYLRQLIELSNAPETLLNPFPLPDAAFYKENLWVILLQLVVFGLLLTLLRRHRSTFLGHPTRRFLGSRPISVSLLVPVFTLTFLYGTPPSLWQMLFQTLAGVAIARLTTAFVREDWINRAIAILVIVLIGFQMLLALGIPMAVMRLFVLAWSVAGAIFYGRHIRIQEKMEGAPWQLWTLRWVVLTFWVIAITDIIGWSGLSIQILSGSIGTAILMIMGWVMIRLIRIMLEMGAERLPMDRFNFLRNTANAILFRIVRIAKAGIAFFVAVNLLVVWNLYTLPSEAAHTLLTFGFTVGSVRITTGLVLVAAIILYATFILSWLVQRALMDKVLSKSHMDTGARLSIARLAHYGLIFIGFLIALSAMGFELKNITIIGSALGIGIGFGMQTLVNNFVSGLILLFERPIKINDVIELSGGQKGRVTKMGLRATTVQTFDKAE